MSKSIVRIVFKSGHVENFQCDRFKVTKTADKVSALEWTNMRPTLMQIDLEQIAAIIEVDT